MLACKSGFHLMALKTGSPLLPILGTKFGTIFFMSIRQLNDFGNFDIFYLLQVSFPVSTWLLFKVEEESLERRKLLCGILAQESLSDDADCDGDGEKNNEPGCVKFIQ